MHFHLLEARICLQNGKLYFENNRILRKLIIQIQQKIKWRLAHSYVGRATGLASLSPTWAVIPNPTGQVQDKPIENPNEPKMPWSMAKDAMAQGQAWPNEIKKIK
ncbi:hypothetical protein AMTR_s00041p00104000 [Amborella trichopoda]|uniref:Uncharacterized protein n=1 Tax=Amborella trichopoda TaxID=13333 RepID=W1PYY7_AMBTC|nr:hypothetical protein AMTR_s00041p00104000 [Amborella trichopoda]